MTHLHDVIQDLWPTTVCVAHACQVLLKFAKEQLDCERLYAAEAGILPAALGGTSPVQEHQGTVERGALALLWPWQDALLALLPEVQHPILYTIT